MQINVTPDPNQGSEAEVLTQEDPAGKVGATQDPAVAKAVDATSNSPELDRVSTELEVQELESFTEAFMTATMQSLREAYPDLREDEIKSRADAALSKALRERDKGGAKNADADPYVNESMEAAGAS